MWAMIAGGFLMLVGVFVGFSLAERAQDRFQRMLNGE